MRPILPLAAVLVVFTACTDTPSSPHVTLPDPGAQVAFGASPDIVPDVRSRILPVSLAHIDGGVIVNGSFETGDYTGWTLAEYAGSSPTCGAWTIASDGQTISAGDAVYDFNDDITLTYNTPYSGVTWTADDGGLLAVQLPMCGSQTHRMAQVITLPAGLPSLHWAMQYQNNAGGGFVSGQQELSVLLRDPVTGALLATLFQTLPGDPQVIPMTAFEADMSAFAGQTVMLSVEAIANIQWFDMGFDHFEVDPGVIFVTIDAPGAVNPKKKGVIAIHVLSDEDFDATTIDVSTASYGPGGAGDAHGTLHAEDVDGDGDLDATFHFPAPDSGIACGDTEAVFSATTDTGTPVEGTHSFKTSGCK